MRGQGRERYGGLYPASPYRVLGHRLMLFCFLFGAALGIMQRPSTHFVRLRRGACRPFVGMRGYVQEVCTDSTLLLLGGVQFGKTCATRGWILPGVGNLVWGHCILAIEFSCFVDLLAEAYWCLRGEKTGGEDVLISTLLKIHSLIVAMYSVYHLGGRKKSVCV